MCIRDRTRVPQRASREVVQPTGPVATARQVTGTADYTLTTLENEQEVEAIQRQNVITHGVSGHTTNPQHNAARLDQEYHVGARVEGNWRGHGEFYNAVVTGINKAGTRVTYDLLYTDDNEPESGMSSDRVRTRRSGARDQSSGLCAHALSLIHI